MTKTTILLTFILTVFASSSFAADRYVRCEYDLPTGKNKSRQHYSFVESVDDKDRWLAAGKADNSIKDFDSKESCHPLDHRRIYHLMTRSENGNVSLIKDLTEDQCEVMKNNLDPSTQHCGSNPKGCMWTVHPGDISYAECFK